MHRKNIWVVKEQSGGTSDIMVIVGRNGHG